MALIAKLILTSVLLAASGSDISYHDNPYARYNRNRYQDNDYHAHKNDFNFRRHGNLYSRHDNDHYDNHREPSTCSPRTPCYDVVLSYIMDGPFVKDMTPGLMEQWYRDAGFSRYEAIRDIREGLDFFYRKYGVRFTGVRDEELLDGSRTVISDDGTAELEPFPISLRSRYRVYAAAVGEKTQLLNAPIKDLFFIVNVLHDRAPAGTFNRTAPRGATFVWGAYLIEQCPDWRDTRDCPKHSILTPHDPRSDIFIRYTSQTYILMDQQPSRFAFTDCDVTHARWGSGTAHGYFPRRVGSRDTEGRNMLVFPDFKY